MRKLFVFSLLILAIFLATPTVEGDVSLDLRKVTAKSSYAGFLRDFRADLPVEKKLVFDIPLLCANVTDRDRYRKVHITNRNGSHTITLAIDVINVYVVGFYSPKCSVSHFFKDHVVAKKFVFTDSVEQITLKFGGSYGDLEGNGASRDEVVLGLPTLNKYISPLYGYGCPNITNIDPFPSSKNIAKGLLVAIQTISEAARFKKIEKAVSNNQVASLEVKSLENKWKKLSVAVQEADRTTRKFTGSDVIMIEDATGKLVDVSDANSTYVKGNLMLLLHKREPKATPELVELSSIIHHNGH